KCPFPMAPILCSTGVMTISSTPTALRRFLQPFSASPRARARRYVTFATFGALAALAAASMSAAAAGAETYLLKPARVFDGVNPQPHLGWQVLVEGDKIAAVGPNLTAPAGAKVVDLPGETLTPGLIEGHSHIFLHPYNETKWDDQVLH